MVGVEGTEGRPLDRMKEENAATPLVLSETKLF